MHGRGAELASTLNWVHEVLLNRAYLEGTRYYEHPEFFLWGISRLLTINDDADLHELLKPLLKSRIQELIGSDGDALQLAMRIVVCDFVGIRDDIDFRALLPLQCEDGSFETGWIYKYGSSGLRIGNKGMTTAMAVKAVELMSPAPATPPSPTLTLVQPLADSTKSKQPSSPVAGSFFSRRTSGLFKTHKRRHSSSIKDTLSWLFPGHKSSTRNPPTNECS